MESLGNKLKTARESKGYAIDNISRDTNISGRYLEALEREDFSVFPGEPYILGFLRNYSAYLELDVNEILSLYRSYKILEQPVPEQLLKNPSPLPKILASVFITLLILALVGTGGWFVLNRLERNKGESPSVRTPQEYAINTEPLERRFYPGDSILVSIAGNTYKLSLAELGETVTITTPEGSKVLDLLQEAKVDFDSDGITDLRITAVDFAKNDSAPGAQLRFEPETLPPAISPAASLGTALDADIPNPDGRGLKETALISTSPNTYPFTLQLEFQGSCLFRWEVLFEAGRQGRNEDFFQRSDRLEIAARNGIRLGASNAQAVRAQVIGGGRTVPLELGGPGEVVALELRWFSDADKGYRLVLAQLE